MSATLQDVVRCPQCSGSAVVYSCEPKCCYNHVCSDCHTSFQVLTERAGGFDRERAVAADAPASGDVTAACAACESLRVALLSSEAPNSAMLLCADCRALLRLKIDEIVPG